MNARHITGSQIIILTIINCLTIHLSAVFAFPVKQVAGETIKKTARPNIVYILTDDQRWDMVDTMPCMAERIKKKGVVFENAFVSTPLCCPSRASFFTGGFLSHWTGVLTNDAPNGGAEALARSDADTIATRLQENGYFTALIGKYVNGYVAYAGSVQENIPPGWSYFAGGEWILDLNSWKAVMGSSTSTQRGIGQITYLPQYTTDSIRDLAISVIDQITNERKPFFLMLTPFAPHAPANPPFANLDHELFKEYATSGNLVYRGRGFGERPDGDVSDKPSYIQEAASNWWDGNPDYYDETHPFMPNARTPDDFFANQMRSLLAVDRMFDAVYRKLEEKKLLQDTIFVFASDNGYMFGEHKLPKGKDVPYEESMRVPFLVWRPGIQHKFVQTLVYANMDLPNTILDYARANQFSESNGKSLKSIIELPDVPHDWSRNRLFFESFSDAGRKDDPLDWAAFRDSRWKFVKYVTGERELYDLENDPMNCITALGNLII